MADGVKQKQRRGLEADWVLSNYILDEGELGVTLDTGVIKIGDGANTWEDLPVALDDYYLPKLGTATNSELLGGISADGFLKFADTDVDPDPDKIAQRDNGGRLKAATGVGDNDVVIMAQIPSIKRELLSRTVSAAATLAVADIGKILAVSNSSTTAQIVITIPTAGAVGPVPIGSWIDIAVVGVGGAKIVPAGGVTHDGPAHVMPSFGVIRLLKTGTDSWFSMDIAGQKRRPQIRVYKNAGGTVMTASTDIAIPFTTQDAANTYNPDSEWFTIPASGLPTARRIVVNKAGLYYCQYNTSVSNRVQSWAKLFKLTADNVLGTELAAAPAYWNASAVYFGRLAANESIGGVFYNGNTSGNFNDEADGLSGHRHDLTIIRVGD